MREGRPEPDPAEEAPRDEGRMSVIDHLEELRSRIIKSLAAFALGLVVAWTQYDRVFGLLVRPYCELPARLRPAVEGQGCGLFFTSVLDPFAIRLKLSALVGFVLAFPIIIYQVWRFVTPGLYPHEKRYAVPFVLSSVLLFAAGSAAGYLTLNKGLEFLLSFASRGQFALLTLDKYLSFFTAIILIFGLTFEYPLLLIFLAWVRVLPSSRMRKWRRGAYFLAFLVAAVATPSQDPYTMLAMAIPLVLFYEASIWVARALGR